MYSFKNTKKTQNPWNTMSELIYGKKIVPARIPAPAPVVTDPVPIDPSIYLNPFVSQTPNVNPTIPTQYINGSQLKTLYNVPNVSASTGIKKATIAIIVAYTYANLRSDLNNYWKNYTNFGPNSTPPVINVYTMPGATFNSGWALEECLDVQMVCTINPNATIWVVEAKSSSISDMMAAVKYASQTIDADVLSMSWGGSDLASISTPLNNSFFTDSSCCFCAASGDSNSVCWPAVLSNCMAVGGSTVIWSPNANNQRTEFTWVNAGSGYSNTISTPNYQSLVNTTAKRSIPDISMVAGQSSMVYIYYSYGTNKPWIPVAGTSVSTPIFASILSIANQHRYNIGKSPLTTVYNTTPLPNGIQNYLYKTVLPNSVKYATLFNDIVIGNDTAGGSSPTYNAGSGFDVATGMGSPNARQFCLDLAANI